MIQTLALEAKEGRNITSHYRDAQVPNTPLFFCKYPSILMSVAARNVAVGAEDLSLEYWRPPSSSTISIPYIVCERSAQKKQSENM
jgi:hypothetical protein